MNKKKINPCPATESGKGNIEKAGELGLKNKGNKRRKDVFVSDVVGDRAARKRKDQT